MSFSSEIKQELAGAVPKSQCCRRAAADGIWKFSDKQDRTGKLCFSDGGDISAFVIAVTETGYGKERCNISSKGHNRVEMKCEFSFDLDDSQAFDAKCPSCATSFFKGVFLSHGRITAPEGGYLLEFSFSIREIAEMFLAATEEYVPGGKIFCRRGKYVVYYKDSTAIEDFTAILGSNHAAFDIMNTKIEKQLRNDANRYSNCSAANLKRAVSNAGKHIDAIKHLEETGRLSHLSAELVYTAKLRMEHPELTLYELSKLTNPPVSKSGLNHRLNKILEYASDIEKKEGNT
ncbi:MAG: DNA-binding protein WhiA [Clostridia bacterium]|nr:DNA-binding protein WhiA [Clostridia bacterium]